MENKYGERKKAFIGAAIGAVASIAGGLIGNAKKKKEEARQRAIAKGNRDYENNLKETSSINQALASYDNSTGEEFEARLQKYGGSTKYRDRKAWGGWGDVVSGVISGVGSVVEGATGIQGISAAGNAIGGIAGGAIGDGITNRMIKKNEEAKQKRLASPMQNPVGVDTTQYNAQLPTKLSTVQRYGGRNKLNPVGSIVGIKPQAKRL